MSLSPRLAMRSAQKIGSSLIDPIDKENVHSPSHCSEPVTLIAGTLNRSSMATFVGSALSVIDGPKISKQPSSTSSSYASITTLTDPLGRPSTSR